MYGVECGKKEIMVQFLKRAYLASGNSWMVIVDASAVLVRGKYGGGDSACVSFISDAGSERLVVIFRVNGVEMPVDAAAATAANCCADASPQTKTFTTGDTVKPVPTVKNKMISSASLYIIVK
jgi:hypothetical protein